MANDNCAIVAGINHYPGITDLQGPENDARWFYKWVTENGLVDKTRASLILSSDFQQNGKKVECTEALPDIAVIDRAFERLLKAGIKPGKVGGRLYLFFAGHGFAPDVNTSALLSSNADLKAGTTGHHLNAGKYADWFAEAAFFDEIVLFMDCCRDPMPRAPERVPPWQKFPNGRQVRRFYGLATKWASKAREAENADGVVHGYFTQALMGALEGGAVAKDGTLNTAQVKAFVINYFTSRVKPKLEAQGLEFVEPVFLPDDDFVMGEGLASKMTRVTFQFAAVPAARRKQYQVVGGKPFTIQANAGSADPWFLDLPLGHYALMDPAGAQVQEFDAFGDEVLVNV